jgi:hypothetical protein
MNKASKNLQKLAAIYVARVNSYFDANIYSHLNEHEKAVVEKCVQMQVQVETDTDFLKYLSQEEYEILANAHLNADAMPDNFSEIVMAEIIHEFPNDFSNALREFTSETFFQQAFSTAYDDYIRENPQYTLLRYYQLMAGM